MEFNKETDYATLTWEEAENEIPEADFVVLPTGSTEQHSLHLPLATDAIVADYMARQYAEHAPEHGLSMRVLPTLPFGYSEHHSNFCGTLTLTPETFKNVVVEIGESLAENGAKRLLIINAHGGNDEPLKLAADRIQRDHDLPVHFRPDSEAMEKLHERFGEGWGHAGPVETSIIEHINPELVRSDRKQEQNRTEIEESRQYAYFDEFTEEGARGDPTGSDPEFMKEVIQEGLDETLETLREDVEEFEG
jgi:creatinine amidohydrolase